MRISFVTDTYSPQPNGVATTLQQLVQGLRGLGNEVDVIRPGVLPCEEEGLKVPSIALPGYPEVRVGLPVRQLLQARWIRNRPDVIYVATESPLGSSAISAARRLELPVASGFHTNFQQYMGHYRLPLLERAAVRYLRHIHNRSTCTFVPSSDVIEQLRSDGFENLEQLPKGVDTGRFNPGKRNQSLRAEWGVTDSGGVVGLYVGRMAAEKNLPLAVRTFTELGKRIPDFRGVFVGGGPRLEALKNVHPEFIYAGTRFGEDLARYYASADLFVFPSLTETFGNVTLEAMASGLGVVAFDYAAAREHIENRVNGYTVPFGFEDEFVEAAVQAAMDPSLPGVRSSARVNSLEVDWNKVIRKFEQTLARLVEKDRDSAVDEYLASEEAATAASLSL